MKLSNNDLLLLSQTAITAAKEAGELISVYSSRDFFMQSKAGGESLASQVLTEVDIKSQDTILKHIVSTCEKYDLGLLTEESTDDSSRFEKDYFWCIDPLDGTLPFVESKSGYAVSIALVSKSGVPYIGVVYDPVEKDIYYAIKGQGAYKNEKEITIKSTYFSSSAFTVIIDRSFFQFDVFDSFGQKIEFVQVGGAVMNALAVIDKAPACYVKFPKSEEGGGSLWDYAATACIFNELGQEVSDIYGQPLDLNRQDSTFMNHKGIIFNVGVALMRPFLNSLNNNEKK